MQSDKPTAGSIIGLMFKMNLFEWFLLGGFIFWGMPAIFSAIWAGGVAHPKFDPDTVNIRDGGSVGWNIGAIVSDVTKGADKEIRPYLEPQPVRRAGAEAEREAAGGLSEAIFQ